jgi:hypothetical protein
VSLRNDDRGVSLVKRHTAKASAISVTATLATGCIAFAAVAGGLFAEAASPPNPVVKQVERIDDYIVVHTTAAETTVAPVTIAAEPVLPEPAPVAPAPQPTEITQPLMATTPQTTAARPPLAAPTVVATPQPSATPEHSAGGGGEREPTNDQPGGTGDHRGEPGDDAAADD